MNRRDLDDIIKDVRPQARLSFEKAAIRGDSKVMCIRAYAEKLVTVTMSRVAAQLGQKLGASDARQILRTHPLLKQRHSELRNGKAHYAAWSAQLAMFAARMVLRDIEQTPRKDAEVVDPIQDVKPMVEEIVGKLTVQYLDPDFRTVPFEKLIAISDITTNFSAQYGYSSVVSLNGERIAIITPNLNDGHG